MSRSLGSHLKEKRVSAGLTQNKVALLLGYGSPQFISNWERGLCKPPLKSMRPLIAILHLNRKEIIKKLVQEYKAEVERMLT